MGTSGTGGGDVQELECARRGPRRAAGRGAARGLLRGLLAGALLGALAVPVALPVRTAAAQGAETPVAGRGEKVQLDFNDVELAVVIDTIARMTGTNFIYDDRVRGRVTIVSPTEMTVDQAYAVFESVLQVKGFTTVEGPGGAIKVIPIREAKESSIDTGESSRRATPNRDQYVTRLIPLQYIDAEAITNTIKPLVSKDASMVAYAPTNTVILTDSASNIRRILAILDSIDVETHREELAVIKIRHADAGTLSEQLAEVYGDDSVTTVQGRSAAARIRARRRAQQQAQQEEASGRQPPRIITDSRTNSLIVLASRARLDEIRNLVARLDVPVTGEGRIQVHYLRHANSEELAQTLNTLLSAQPQAGGGNGQRGATPQALQAAVEGLSDSVTVTADPATNALVIQASKEAYQTLLSVIEKLDIQRPQVLVEALIMEVDVSDAETLGFRGLVEIFQSDETNFAFQSLGSAENNPLGATGGLGNLPNVGQFVTPETFAAAVATEVGESVIQAIIDASAQDNGTNILSAPHILTSDNEESEIRIGSNIPIVTSRVQSAAGVDVDTGLSTSQNIERRDIGVTLRVTPQISEGDTLRMEIFQEISDIASGLSVSIGDPQEVGVPLSTRTIENTVVVGDGETVVIGGLLSDNFQDQVTKVPFLGDIPVLGWLFKNTSKTLTKQNLLVFLTPHIIRKSEDLEFQSIRKREEFRRKSREAVGETHPDRRIELDEYGLPVGEFRSENPARNRLDVLEQRYPLERMKEIEEQRQERRREAEEEAQEEESLLRYRLDVGPYRDDQEAADALTELIDAGYEGRLVSRRDDDRVLYDLRVGPYPELEEAERAAGVLESAFQLDATIVVERGPADGEGNGDPQQNGSGPESGTDGEAAAEAAP